MCEVIDNFKNYPEKPTLLVNMFDIFNSIRENVVTIEKSEHAIDTTFTETNVTSKLGDYSVTYKINEKIQGWFEYENYLFIIKTSYDPYSVITNAKKGPSIIESPYYNLYISIFKLKTREFMINNKLDRVYLRLSWSKDRHYTINGIKLYNIDKKEYTHDWGLDQYRERFEKEVLSLINVNIFRSGINTEVDIHYHYNKFHYKVNYLVFNLDFDNPDI